MNKDDYRSLFKSWKKYIKFNSFIKELGIIQPNFSYFMNGSNRSMNIKELNDLYDLIVERLDQLIA